jgi:hypothetical protein
MPEEPVGEPDVPQGPGGLFRTLVRNADVQNGLYDIHWLEEFLRTGGLDAG